MPTTKLTLLAVSKDEWDTKEGPCKSMKNVHGMAKGTHQTEAMLNSMHLKIIKPVALAIVNLCKSEGISQSGS